MKQEEEMDMQPQEAGSPSTIARTALVMLGLDPEAIAEVSILPRGVSACDAFLLRMDNGDVLVLKAQLSGGSPQLISALKREAMFFSRLATRVPIRTPHVRSISTNERTGVLILTDYSPPSPPVEEWTEALYLRAAEDLGRFHATFHGSANSLSAFTFVNRRSLDVSNVEIAHARECWAYVAAQDRFKDIVTQERLDLINGWIETVANTQSLLAAIPQTLIHGDCNPDNVWMDTDGAFVWANWSGVSIGRGPEDISFFYQRADFAGGLVPWDAMIAAYHKSLRSALGVDIPFDDIRRAAEASEWSVRLLQWPHYMDYASPETLQAFIERLDVLAEHLGVGVE